MSQTPLLELENIDALYGPVRALHAISLSVATGEIVCLLGGNASGKSTAMKIILGLLKPHAGVVRFAGHALTGLTTAQRGIASVPEARRIFPDLTVTENLRLGAYIRHETGAIRDDMTRMLDLFPRLKERRTQLGGTLSGGEQQMLALARALMSRPRLLCMDEPMMGLAPIFVDRELDFVTQINRQGVTVFMVEQNATLALSIATRGYVLQNGTIFLEGPAQTLRDNPTIREAYLGEVAGDRAEL